MQAFSKIRICYTPMNNELFELHEQETRWYFGKQEIVIFNYVEFNGKTLEVFTKASDPLVKHEWVVVLEEINLPIDTTAHSKN